MLQQAKVQVAGIEFAFSVDVEDSIQPTLKVQSAPVDDLDETYLVRCTVSAPGQHSFCLRDLCIEWTLPITDMHGLYFGGNPRNELSYLPFWRTSKNICANTGVPYLALINRNGENRAAFGVFDQITETTMHAELSEITRCYHFRLRKPANKDSSGQVIPVTEHWEETLFVSKSRQG